MKKLGLIALMGLTLAACSPRQERVATGAGIGAATAPSSAASRPARAAARWLARRSAASAGL